MRFRLFQSRTIDARSRAKLMASDSSRCYTPKDIQKEFGIPVRKTAYLIRTGLLEADLEDGNLSIGGQDLIDYVSQSHETVQRHHISYLKTLGPGLITGASDNDPSGIGTYTQIGSAYGLGLSWLALYLLPMMTAVQETVARIGIVTQRGLASVIEEHFGKKTLFPLVILLIIANTVNIGADLGAMVAALQLLVPVDFYIALVLLTIGIALLETFVPYHRYARILKWLTLSLFAYLITAFLIKPDWGAIGMNVIIPHIQLDTGFLVAAVATMGTTITPYLFFWQTSEEVEEKIDNGSLDDFRTTAIHLELHEMRKDTWFGMTLASIVFLSIVVTAAFVLNANGITDVGDAMTAAMALAPLAGNFASALFAVGIFGVGLLAVPVLAGASAYALAEMFGWKEGLGRKTRTAPAFYMVIVLSLLAGLVLNLVGVNPMKALYYAAILNGAIAPVLMFFIFRMGSDEKIVGPFTSATPVRVVGWIATVLMGVSAIVLIVLLATGA